MLENIESFNASWGIFHLNSYIIKGKSRTICIIFSYLQNAVGEAIAYCPAFPQEMKRENYTKRSKITQKKFSGPIQYCFGHVSCLFYHCINFYKYSANLIQGKIKLILAA